MLTKKRVSVNLKNSMVVITNYYIMQKGENENENSIHMNANSIINQKTNMNANAIAKATS